MHANAFDYYRAGSVGEAVDLLGAHEGARPVAGAHDLLPRMKTGETAPPALVDIGGIDGLAGIERDGDSLSVGALATHAEVAASGVVRESATALAEAAESVGDTQVRHGGTVGGNLAAGDPRADLAAAALALDGSVTVAGPDGERSVDVAELLVGPRETALGERELLTGLRVAADGDDSDDGDGATSAYRTRRNPLSGYATVGVAAWVRVEDGVVEDARVAATAVGPTPARLSAVETELVGAPATEEIEAAAARAGEAFDPATVRTDPRTSADYRLHALEVYTRRTLEAVL
jgi:carbon-monoxide dehydrogenase medium subunit